MYQTYQMLYFASVIIIFAHNVHANIVIAVVDQVKNCPAAVNFAIAV